MRRIPQEHAKNTTNTMLCSSWVKKKNKSRHKQNQYKISLIFAVSTIYTYDVTLMHLFHNNSYTVNMKAELALRISGISFYC